MSFNKVNPWKSIAAGALGGLVASLAMNQYQAAVTAVSKSMSRLEQGEEAEEQKQQTGDDATVKAAQSISAGLFDHNLSDDEKKWAGPAVHYALGTTLGAIYGALASHTSVQAGVGVGYGTAVWLIADEAAVPSLGLAPAPTQTPLASHVNAWSSHVVYGLVTHLVRKIALS